MIRVSTEPVDNGRKILNDGFGNRCVICGGHFDEGDICNNRHQKGQVYYILSDKEKS